MISLKLVLIKTQSDLALAKQGIFSTGIWEQLKVPRGSRVYGVKEGIMYMLV
jgi:hypothetical protein